MADEKALVVRASEIAEQEGSMSHPWNPSSLIIGTPLGRLVGLQRTGVSLARIPEGKESFIYHSHWREEEWIYILSGEGIAEVDDEEIEVSAGDFMGFPTPSVAHHLRNAGREELVYLMGGENLDIEIAEVPRLGRRLIRTETKVEIYDLADARDFSSLPVQDDS